MRTNKQWQVKKSEGCETRTSEEKGDSQARERDVKCLNEIRENKEK